MKKYYVRKSPNLSVYKWSPESNDKEGKRGVKQSDKFCNAKPNSQGEDFIVTYVHDKYFDARNKEHRPAYVECDYVK